MRFPSTSFLLPNARVQARRRVSDDVAWNPWLGIFFTCHFDVVNFIDIYSATYRHFILFCIRQVQYYPPPLIDRYIRVTNIEM